MEQLGIEPKLLLAQIINFGIIVVVLTKLLYKPILSMLEKRRREIEEGLSLTEKMRQEEEKLQIRKEKLLSDARREGHAILEDARKQSKEEEKDIVRAAHEEAEALIQKGKEEVKRLKEELSHDLRAEAIMIAASMTKRLVEGILTTNDKRILLDKHIKELEKLKQ